ncbi:cation diffusion facilitator family transporter [Uruburuella testudinis]|uniref:Cation diffusion facilitator family transporter n=1 Tax=Uruburuella testudinis TaxID=1282863 RepID=A0ABY4DQJ5_9NEIS|nr:cation diffusion facilitator family transporter [Uruburuella testudinis]UOO80999.1 cation diffusion facilitator family transporter [Uruburuella testudinis]
MENQRAKLLKLATYASVGTAVLLVGLKTWAWLAEGSVSVLASMVDSLTDSLASLVNLFAVHWALKPADEDHQFGHGKAEGLSALAQSAFIGGSSVFLILNAVERLFKPEPVLQTDLGMAVIVVSVLLTLALVWFQRWVLKRTQSQAVRADSLHYVTDLLSNGVVLAALLLTAYGWPLADPLLAVLVGLWIFKSAWHIAADAVNTLMDKAPPPEIMAQIEAAALAVAGVRGIHKLQARVAGAQYFIQLHVDLSDKLNIVAAHDIAETVAERVQALFDRADVIVHQDPVNDAGEHVRP